MPDRRRQGTAGDALHRRRVVVADPDGGDIILGEADEPGVVEILRRAGFAGRRMAGDGGAASSSFGDDAIKHRDEIAVDMTGDDAFGILWRLSLIEQMAALILDRKS